MNINHKNLCKRSRTLKLEIENWKLEIKKNEKSLRIN